MALVERSRERELASFRLLALSGTKNIKGVEMMLQALRSAFQGQLLTGWHILSLNFSV